MKTIPFAVLSIDCFPDPRRECTPGTHDGTSLSRIGPICLHIRSKWSGAICLLAAICRANKDSSEMTLVTATTTSQINSCVDNLSILKYQNLNVNI